jgi:hypothetical protein
MIHVICYMLFALWGVLCVVGSRDAVDQSLLEPHEVYITAPRVCVCVLCVKGSRLYRNPMRSAICAVCAVYAIYAIRAIYAIYAIYAFYTMYAIYAPLSLHARFKTGGEPRFLEGPLVAREDL